jgi:hypothetical protein
MFESCFSATVYTKLGISKAESKKGRKSPSKFLYSGSLIQIMQHKPSPTTEMNNAAFVLIVEDEQMLAEPLAT